MKLADITRGLTGQPMFSLLAQAEEMERSGREIIHFEIGDPNFVSPSHVKDAAKMAIDKNLTHYTNSMGILECREAVVDYVNDNLGFRPSIEQILICPANAIIDFVVRCVVNPGEEIIHPDPGFPTYSSVIEYNGMVSVGAPLEEKNNFRMNPDDVSERITKKTKLLVVNTPQNPTGAVMTRKEVFEMARIAELNNLYLLSDEVYSAITYDKTHHSPTKLDQCKERSILLGSLSKNFSMSGWRLGYAVGPKKLIEKMGLLLETTSSCVSPFIQRGGIEALLGKQNKIYEMVDEYRKRRDVMIKGLNSLPGISCFKPKGAFYAFPNIIETGYSSQQFTELVLEKAGVAVTPGPIFGNYGEGFVRLCYVNSIVNIEKAIKNISAVLT